MSKTLWDRDVGRFVSLFVMALIAGCATSPPPDQRTAASELRAVVQGDLLLGCREAGCAYDFGSKRRRMHALYSEQKWEQLAVMVASVGHASDLAYFYLARAAEGLGHRGAADWYYGLAQSERARNRCEDVIDRCDGLHLAEEILEGRLRLAALASAEQARSDSESRASAAEEQSRHDEQAAKEKAQAEEEAARIRAAAEAHAALADRKREQQERCSREIVLMSPFLDTLLKKGIDDSATIKLLEKSAQNGDPFAQMLLFLVSLNDDKGDLNVRRARIDLAIAGASRTAPVIAPKSCDGSRDVLNFLRDVEGIRVELTQLQVTLDVSDIILDYAKLKGDLRRVKGFYLAAGELEYLYEKQGSATFVMVDTKGLSRAERKRLLVDCPRGCPVVLDGTVEDVFMSRGIRARFLR